MIVWGVYDNNTEAFIIGHRIATKKEATRQLDLIKNNKYYQDTYHNDFSRFEIKKYEIKYR